MCLPLCVCVCVHVYVCACVCVCPAGLIREGLVQVKFVAPSLLIHPQPVGLGPLMKPTKVNQLQWHTHTHSSSCTSSSYPFVSLSLSSQFLFPSQTWLRSPASHHWDQQIHKAPATLQGKVEKVQLPLIFSGAVRVTARGELIMIILAETETQVCYIQHVSKYRVSTLGNM